MFQFAGFASPGLCVQPGDGRCTAGFPHWEIHGSAVALTYSWLFAECYVLRRLLTPRHSPNALAGACFVRAGVPVGAFAHTYKVLHGLAMRILVHHAVRAWSDNSRFTGAAVPPAVSEHRSRLTANSVSFLNQETDEVRYLALVSVRPRHSRRRLKRTAPTDARRRCLQKKLN